MKDIYHQNFYIGQGSGILGAYYLTDEKCKYIEDTIIESLSKISNLTNNYSGIDWGVIRNVFNINRRNKKYVINGTQPDLLNIIIKETINKIKNAIIEKNTEVNILDKQGYEKPMSTKGFADFKSINNTFTRSSNALFDDLRY